jgi:small subunit ribosomal protein S8
MNMTDSIADFLTHIRNSVAAGHGDVHTKSSTLRKAIANILKEEGFIEGFQEIQAKPQSTLKIGLRYTPNRRPVIRHLQRVSKPGLRIYVGAAEIPRVLGGLGIVILSTSKGVMSGEKARKERIGGEILCRVW